MTSISFEKLSSADLVIDAIYESDRNDSKMSYGSEPLHHLIPGIGNAGGFRKCSSVDKKRTIGLVLASIGDQREWPDNLDPYTGLYTYYGDNRKPGKDLHDTRAKGNNELRRIFDLAHGDAESRANCPLTLIFESGGRSRDMVFRGLAVPGSQHHTQGDDLVALWKMGNGQRFQNYRATFTILDTGTISGDWVRHVFSKRFFHPDHPDVPSALREWIYFGKYIPLRAHRDLVARPIKDQVAREGLPAQLIEGIIRHCSEDPFLFEPIAAAIWQMSSAQHIEYELTKRFRDGGRDATGFMLLGPIADPIKVSFSLEAKCYTFPNSKVGVREMSRLISRIKQREFGVLVTTSVVDKQAYEEIRNDGHPIVVLAAQDIAEILIKAGINSTTKLSEWMNSGKF